MRKLFLFMMMLLALTVPFVSASADYDINQVYVNGVEVTFDNLVYVQADTTAIVTVILEGTNDIDNVQIRAWIGGYEYSTIEDTTEIFDVEDGVLYTKTLYLEIPEDLDTTDSEYTLHVDAYDVTGSTKEDYNLFFEKERHNIVVEDVLFSPTTVAPGGYVAVNVRLENLGETFEDDIAVTAYIEDLGISNRVYLDELDVNDQDDSGSILLIIPDDAREGTYVVSVDVEYDNGHSTTSDFALLTIDGDNVQYDENALVSMSSISGLTVGEETTFKVQITNFESTSKEFTLTVSGMPAQYEETVLVAGGSTTEVAYTLTPIQSGLQNIYISVLSNEGIVLEKQYSIDVTENGSILPLALLGLFVLAVLAQIIVILRRTK